MKTPFVTSPIGAIVGFIGAKAAGVTDFWAMMGLVIVGMAVAWFAAKKAGEKFS